MAPLNFGLHTAWGRAELSGELQLFVPRYRSVVGGWKEGRTGLYRTQNSEAMKSLNAQIIIESLKSKNIISDRQVPWAAG